MTEDKIKELRVEKNKLMEEKRKRDELDSNITRLQYEVHTAEKEEQRKKQELINAEARVLRKAGLGEGLPCLPCFKCKAMNPVTHVRETVSSEGEAGWFSLEAVCPKCSSEVSCVNPENKRFCKVVTYALIRTLGQGFGDYYHMKNG